MAGQDDGGVVADDAAAAYVGIVASVDVPSYVRACRRFRKDAQKEGCLHPYSFS